MDEAKERDGGKQRPLLPPPTEQKILLFDIETAPLLAYIWQPKTRYVHQHALVAETFMLTWAAKWYDSPNVMTGIATSSEAKNQDDTRIVGQLCDLIRDADIVIAHNSDRFDVPTVNARLAKLRLEPMGPVKTIDTLTVAKQSFRLPYYNLNYLGEFFGVGEKIPTDFDLWRRCYLGEKPALVEMATYNRQDVVLLQNVFDAMKPYAKRLPRMFDPGWDGQLACPHCGSSNLVIRGYHRTNVSTFPKFRCSDCRRYHRGRSSILHPKFKVTPV